jgi:hypothetical protein
MDHMVAKEISELITETKSVKARKFYYKDLKGLPAPVQKYFRYVLKDGQEYIRFVEMKASGKFRPPLHKKWLNTSITQYISTEKPALIFNGVAKQNVFFWFKIRDKYHHGKGNMIVNLLSGFNVVNLHDVEELNKTSFTRWIGEAVLFPTALLPSQYIKWLAIDDSKAKAIVTDGENSGEYIFHFNKKGEIVKYISNDRYDKFDEGFQKVGSIALRSNYKTINDMKIPTEFAISRVLPDGTKEDFWIGKINHIQFNSFEK